MDIEGFVLAGESWVGGMLLIVVFFLLSGRVPMLYR